MRTGAVLTVGFAGCSGDDSDETAESTADGDTAKTVGPGAVVRSFYTLGDEISSDASGDQILDKVDPALHSKSPLRELFSDSEGDASGDDRTLSSVETDVTQENLSAEELNSQFLSFYQVEQRVVESLAEENAVVQATVEYEDAETQEPQHLTATENGDWQVFT